MMENGAGQEPEGTCGDAGDHGTFLCADFTSAFGAEATCYRPRSGRE